MTDVIPYLLYLRPMEPNDKVISDLIQDVFNSLEVSAANNTKAWTENNTILNLGLTISAIFFAFGNRTPVLPMNNSEMAMTIASRYFFVVAILAVILHKYIFSKHEELKYKKLANLKLHTADMKYDIGKVKLLYDFTRPFKIVDYQKAFESGKLYDEQFQPMWIRYYEKVNKRIEFNREGMAVTYWVGLMFAIFYFSTSILTILH